MANEYEVERILGERKVNGTIKFNVKWKGYSETTWEPKKNVNECIPYDVYLASKKLKKEEELENRRQRRQQQAVTLPSRPSKKQNPKQEKAANSPLPKVRGPSVSNRDLPGPSSSSAGGKRPKISSPSSSSNGTVAKRLKPLFVSHKTDINFETGFITTTVTFNGKTRTFPTKFSAKDFF